MTDWIWALMFMSGLSIGIIVGLWVSQRRDQQYRDQFNQAFRDSFSSLSAEALQRNTDHQRATLENTLKPVQDTLKRTQEQIQAIERERHTAFGQLTQQLEHAVTAQNELRQETQNLSQALARPQVSGSYGEVTLRRVIEIAGMTKHVDFLEQDQQSSGARPDVVVYLPEKRVLPIDAKAPLQKYLSAHQESDPRRRKQQLGEFARGMREMVKNLSRKEYWSGFEDREALDFVVMFVPGDQFLNVALEQDPDLMEYALQQKVLLTTPSSLMAILRAVAYGWNQQKIAEHATQVQKLGAELYKRVSVFTDHMSKLGKSLDSGIKSFNRMLGSWESRVLPTLGKFRDLGVAAPDIEEVKELTERPRHADAGDDAPDDAA